VDQITSPTENPVRATPAVRIFWALLIVATLYICYFTHLDAIGLAGPDEPRYAWIARDMAESGDWVTPRLYGKPWFEKPVLYYWSAAIFFKFSGQVQTQSPTAQTSNPQSSGTSPEKAARLPSAIYALLATLAVAWLALRLYDPQTARWLLLLLPTSVAMIGFSHAAATDMPFSATLAVAMVAAAVLLGIPAAKTSSTTTSDTAAASFESFTSLTSSTFFVSFVFGFSLGLAVLAKGPAALILSGGAIFLWELRMQKWRAPLKLFHPVAIITFCATALPWYILCARRNPDFFRVFIIEHNFKRYLTPEFQHIQPFWYYIPVLLLAFFPWTILLLGAVISGVRHIRQATLVSQATFYLLCWSAFCILFFTTSHSKLPGYILPAIPALALLLCRFCFTLGATHRRQIGLTFLIFAGFALIIALLVIPMHIHYMHANRDFESLKFVILIILILIFFTNSLLAWSFLQKNSNARSTLLATSTIPVIVFLLFSGKSLWSADHIWFSAKQVAKEIQDRAIPLDRLSVQTNKNRAWRYTLNFYLHREIPDWDDNSKAEAFLISDKRNGCSLLSLHEFQCSSIPLGPSAEGWWVVHITPNSSTSQSSP
jgi:4-amino-4-deoxy-L-arabinose transferase-like glycosyltransferase